MESKILVERCARLGGAHRVRTVVPGCSSTRSISNEDDETMTDTTVVHCKVESYDVLIDRTTKWGNPFPINEFNSREAVIAQYKVFLWDNIKSGEVSLNDLADLHGKVLGCWCAPRACHGDVLAAAAKWADEITHVGIMPRLAL